VKYSTIVWKDLSATATIASFEPAAGVAEHHIMIQLSDRRLPVATQYKNIATATSRLQEAETFRQTLPVFKRYFVSDAANQQVFVSNGDGNENGNEDGATAVSIVQQPPLNGTKVSVWLYLAGDGKLAKDEVGTTLLERPSYQHLYNTQLHRPVGDEYAETAHIFRTYTDVLKQRHCTLKAHCIRTWLYVQGVDIHYAGMVKARIECFDREGLTNETHYIASTGIEGRHPNPQTLVQMDAYAVNGILPEQIKHLYARTHLNPTAEYGVTFERGTAVDYGDRRHVFISGTASIDNKGEIVHLLNIEKQMERTMENISVLLSEAQTDTADIAQMIIYLRDMADYYVVSTYFEKHYANIPSVIVLAPVCRPGWLIEVECIAIKPIEDARFARF
jgi:enamine deaminase RidA (YjgF/YER057c/UK114 family)